MKDLNLKDWQDYWKIFEELIILLSSENKNEISFEFKEAQKHVNGFTDGWYEFKFAFEKALKYNRQKLTEQQTDIADFLLNALNKRLTNKQ